MLDILYILIVYEKLTQFNYFVYPDYYLYLI